MVLGWGEGRLGIWGDEMSEEAMEVIGGLGMEVVVVVVLIG